MAEVAERPLSANREAKTEVVAALAAQFRESSATMLTEYRGLSVSQLKQLRRSLGSTTSYAVTKNTLAKRAAADAGLNGLDDLLVGPTAIAFVSGDPVDAAKGLRDFTKENPALVIKGGVLEGKPLSPAEINKLAELESREVLLAKLAGAMKANLSGAAALFQAPIVQMARLAAALQEKKAATAPAQEQ
ncbi:MAG: 50S ribosomal protein L10 [Mycobacteriales bacterium]